MHADEADAPATLARLLHQDEQAGASDVHLHRTGDSAQVAFRLDGVLTPVTTLPPALAERLFDRIKYLARGTPLSEAVGRRRFPELFVRLVRVGAQGHDLPGLLTLLADYYQRRHSLGTRLQAVLVYPALVLAGAIALSLFFLWFHHQVRTRVAAQLLGQMWNPAITPLLWLPPIWLVAIGLTALGLGLWPASRHWLHWRLANAAFGRGGFLAGLSGWQEALEARAFRAEQVSAQLLTTGLVLLNGGLVTLLTVGVFQVLINIIQSLVLW